jgi:hypothetical protein
MTMTPGAAPSRIFYGWWVALALSILGLDRGTFSLVIAGGS